MANMVPSGPGADPLDGHEVGATGSRVGFRASTYGRLLSQENFRLLWLAQVVSTVGTYAYALAMASLLTQRTSDASLGHTVAFVVGIQAGAAAITGLMIAGPVADRFNRRRTMIVSDVVRFVAVATLLVGAPSTVHIAAVAAVLGCFGALFDPCLAASLPNVVREDEIVPANAVIGGTFYGSAMIGPGLGALLVSVLGARLAFGMNAMSFVASAALLTATSFRNTPRTSGRLTPLALVRDLRDGARHVRSSRLARGIIVTMGVAMIAWGAQATIQIVFVKEVLAPGAAARPLRAVAFATLTTAWAAGMLIGSLASPLAIRRFARERLVPVAITIIGTCVFVGATSSSLLRVAALWFIGGVMSGAANVCYESLLQERTPDRFRGRVMATIEAAQEGMYLSGIALAAVLVSFVEAPQGLMTVAALTCVAALVGYRMLQPAGLESDNAIHPVEPPPARATDLRTRPSPVAGGPWPGWMPSLSLPWTVERHGRVAHLRLHWPLVASDWDAIIDELSQAIADGANAVILPTMLPAGSRVSHRQLDELWSALIAMSVTVRRSADPERALIEAPVSQREVPRSGSRAPKVG